MTNDKNLFAATQWVLRFALVATVVLVGLLVCAAVGVVVAWNNGFLAENLAKGAAEVGQMSLNVGGYRMVFDPRVDVTVADVARLALVGITGGAAVLVLAHFILRAIHRVVVSATVGDPFVAENAAHIARIAWLLLGIFAVQILTSLGISAFMPASLHTAANHDSIDIPFAGLFAMLLIFVLARIFRRGAEMRAELEGTV